MREGDLEGALLAVLGKSGGADLLQEAAEFSLDALLDDGTVKDIPIVGTIAKLYSVAKGAQGYVFAKKIRTFLTELRSIPEKEREAFAEQLEKDKEQRQRTAETLIVLLDKLDDMKKAPLLARAFAAYAREDIDFSTFQRLAAAIDRGLVSDLPILERFSGPEPLDGYIGDMLVSTGLVSVAAIPGIRGRGAKTAYEISELGELFVQVVLKGLPRNH